MHVCVLQIEQAAREANASEFIDEFPDGYNTLVGERGQVWLMSHHVTCICTTSRSTTYNTYNTYNTNSTYIKKPT